MRQGGCDRCGSWLPLKKLHCYGVGAQYCDSCFEVIKKLKDYEPPIKNQISLEEYLEDELEDWDYKDVKEMYGRH